MTQTDDNETPAQSAGKRSPYYYRVDEYVRTHGRNGGQEESFTHSLDFQFDTPQESREQAYAYYTERLEFLSTAGNYFLPFALAKDPALGCIALYSLTLYFVACYNEDEYYLFGLEGVDEEERKKALQAEEECLKADGKPECQ